MFCWAAGAIASNATNADRIGGPDIEVSAAALSLTGAVGALVVAALVEWVGVLWERGRECLPSAWLWQQTGTSAARARRGSVNDDAGAPSPDSLKTGLLGGNEPAPRTAI